MSLNLFLVSDPALLQSTEVLLQYVEFLVQSIGPERYAKLIPSFTELAADYGLAPSLAFHILRPKLSHAIKVSPSASRRK